METRRVFVFWTHPLFYEAVRLLLDDPSIDLVGAISDYVSAQQQIMKLQPDTIIVEESEGDRFGEILVFLKNSPAGARVIGLNLLDNQLFVYQRERKTVGQADDLLRLVQGLQA